MTYGTQKNWITYVEFLITQLKFLELYMLTAKCLVIQLTFFYVFNRNIYDLIIPLLL